MPTLELVLAVCQLLAVELGGDEYPIAAESRLDLLDHQVLLEFSRKNHLLDRVPVRQLVEHGLALLKRSELRALELDENVPQELLLQVVLRLRHLAEVADDGKVARTADLGNLRLVVGCSLLVTGPYWTPRVVLAPNLLLLDVFDIKSHLVSLVDPVKQEHHELCPLHSPISVDVDLQEHEHESKDEIVVLCRPLLHQSVPLVLEFLLLLLSPVVVASRFVCF